MICRVFELSLALLHVECNSALFHAECKFLQIKLFSASKPPGYAEVPTVEPVSQSVLTALPLPLDGSDICECHLVEFDAQAVIL